MRGEIEDTGYKQPGKRKSGKAGGKARAETLTQEERIMVAKKGAKARWGNEGVGTRVKAASRTKARSSAMERAKFILAAASPAGGDSLSPVQVQKLFFLLDENVAKKADGPYFDFQPYDYGPFDKEVYGELEQLAEKGLVEITVSGGGMRTYRLTNEGYHAGNETFQGFEKPVQEYIKKTVDFVRSLSFAELVSAIYEAYPEMKKNSVFA